MTNLKFNHFERRKGRGNEWFCNSLKVLFFFKEIGSLICIYRSDKTKNKRGREKEKNELERKYVISKTHQLLGEFLFYDENLNPTILFCSLFFLKKKIFLFLLAKLSFCFSIRIETFSIILILKLNFRFNQFYFTFIFPAY